MSYWLLYSMTAMGRWQKREQKDNAGGGVDSTGLYQILHCLASVMTQS